MTRQEYLFIKLISNNDWFDWQDIEYTATQFHTWQEQGFIQTVIDMPRLERPQGVDVTYRRLTPQAHNLLGKQDE